MISAAMVQETKKAAVGAFPGAGPTRSGDGDDLSAH